MLLNAQNMFQILAPFGVSERYGDLEAEPTGIKLDFGKDETPEDSEFRLKVEMVDSGSSGEKGENDQRSENRDGSDD